MRGSGYLPTPRANDGKGLNQRRNRDNVPGAIRLGVNVPPNPNRMSPSAARPAPTPEHGHGGGSPLGCACPDRGFAWGLDDGHGVDWRQYGPAIGRWERIGGRSAPCPTQVSGGLRRWVTEHAKDPTLFDPRWLVRHAPWDADHGMRVDQPIRERILRRWRSTDDGSDLIDPMFWPGDANMGMDMPIPATRLPVECVTSYWRARHHGSRFPALAHLSPRFVEWMMGLQDGWVSEPRIWRNVPGSHRNLQLRALGNGVVPAQAACAVNWALDLRARLAVTP